MPEKDLTARVRVQADDARPIEEIEQSLRDLEPAAKGAARGLGETESRSKAASSGLSRLRQGVASVAERLRDGARRMKEFVREGLGIDKVSSSFSGFKGVLGGLGIAALLVQVKRLFGFTLEASDRQAKAVAQIEAAIKSTGGAAGLTSKELQEMASGLQQVTKVGDEVILEGQSILLTFTKIGKEIFPEVTERALDVSERLGQDLKSSVTQLGKALNDPIAGLSALSRVGIQFSDSQKEAIKAAVDAGDVLSAQKIILKELEVEFGGAARAARETWGGSIDAAKNAAGDFLEKVGEGGLNGALSRLAQRFTESAEQGSGFARRIGQVLGSVVEIVGGAVTGIKAGFETIAGGVGIGLAVVAESFLKLGELIAKGLGKLGFDELSEKLQSQLSGVAEVVRNFRETTQEETEKDLRRAQSSLRETVDNLVSIWQDGGQKTAQASAGVAQAVESATDQAADSLGKLDSRTQEAIDHIAELLGKLPEDAKENAEALSKAWESFDANEIRQRFTVLDDAAREELKQSFEAAVDAIRASGGEISEEMVRIGNSIGVLISAFDPLAGAASGAASAVQDSSGQIAESIDVVTEKYDEAGQKIVTTQRITQEAARKMTLEEIREAGPRLQEYVKRLKEADEGLGETQTQAQNAAEALADPAAKVAEVSRSVGDLAGKSQDLASAQQSAGEAAQSQATGLGQVAEVLKSQDLTQAVDDLRSKLESLNEIDFSPLVSQLDSVVRKAQEAARAVASIDSAAEGGGV